jgi:glycosyltransferase involved in cell wall biosynthesis
MGAPGCDDAPLIDIPIGRTCKLVTFVYPYYENPQFLAKQLCRWGTYPKILKTWFSVILVDDGSPTRPAETVVRECVKVGVVPDRLRLFRIGVDVRWNWLAARNIGAHEADDEWLLLTDMDHVVGPDLLKELVMGEHDPKIIYRFSRREHTGQAIHPHPNSWFMTRKMFWKVGGYDEALSGHYGTDGEYRRRCAATAKIRISTSALERHEYVVDSSTTGYLRKQPEDARAKQLIRARGPEWRPKVLSFPYEEVRIEGLPALRESAAV